MAECLNDDLVLTFARGGLPSRRFRDVYEHLCRCADCRTLVAEAAKYFHGNNAE